MSYSVLIFDNSSIDTNWLISCLLVSSENNNCSAYKDLDQLKIFAPDVFLVSEKMLRFFHNIRKASDSQAIRETPYIILTESEKSGVNIVESDDIETLAKSMITPRLLSFVIRHVVKNSQDERELKNMFHYDQLTHAANRHLFLDRLSQIVLQTESNYENFGIIFLGLDDFKQINDTYGLNAGDHLLKTLIKRIKISFRESDTIARMGGLEFALLLPQITSPEQMTGFVEKLFCEIRRPITWKNNKLQIKAAAGVALFPMYDFEMNTNNIIDIVNNALQEAKKCSDSDYKWCE